MRRVVKYGYIGNEVTKINSKIKELIDVRDKLKSDILTLETCYQGEDGEKLKNSYLSQIRLIDEYIKNVKNYSGYFSWAANEYSSCQRKARNGIGLYVQASHHANDYIEIDEMYE